MVPVKLPVPVMHTVWPAFAVKLAALGTVAEVVQPVVHCAAAGAGATRVRVKRSKNSTLQNKASVLVLTALYIAVWLVEVRVIIFLELIGYDGW